MVLIFFLNCSLWKQAMEVPTYFPKLTLKLWSRMAVYMPAIVSQLALENWENNELNITVSD